MLPCLLPDPTIIEFTEVELEGQSIACQVSSTQTTVSCPICAQPVERVHSRYKRKLFDLPWAGLPVHLWLLVRRFFCDNADCVRQIFCERVPTVAAPWARRTHRMAEAQRAIALTAGGAGGARLCAALEMDGGIDLLLELIRSGQAPEPPTPKVLGVDDWAMRKGQTYGTILVDLETGNVVDVLPERTAAGLAEWLETHPGVEIVSRDRAGAYAEGVRLGAPDAIQVADRWHLLKNLTDSVYKILQKHQAAIEKQLVDDRSLPSTQEVSVADVELSERATDEEHLSAAAIARQQRVTEAQKLHQEGWSNKAIAAHLGVCPKTVRRYLTLELPLAPQRRSGRSSLLDPFKSYIVERWNAGCHNAAQLYREIQAQGFSGKATIVRDFAAQLRQKTGTVVPQDPSERPPTVRTLAHLIGRPADKLDEKDKAYMTRLGAVNPELETVISLVREFTTMVRQRLVEPLDNWLDKAKDSLLRAFAAGLRQDEDAVRAALSLPWSNGPTEGHINRLKCLKRQMYGRANLDLLRQRLLAA